jgi:ankyrin repeat protein
MRSYFLQSSFLILALFAVLGRGAQQEDDDILQSAFSNNREGVQSALAAGANPNVRDSSSGQTALMGAVLRGNVPVVELLLTVDAVDVSIPEKDGYTPAHGAGFQGRAEIMRLLAAAGLNVKDEFHSDGYAPLHRACWGNSQGHTDTIRVLAQVASVDLNMPSRHGTRCIDMTSNPSTIALLTTTATEAVKGQPEEL